MLLVIAVAIMLLAEMMWTHIASDKKDNRPIDMIQKMDSMKPIVEKAASLRRG